MPRNIRKQAEFTPTEMRLIYAIVDEYGTERKPELMREIKSLIRYDRVLMKQRISNALKGLL